MKILKRMKNGWFVFIFFKSREEEEEKVGLHGKNCIRTREKTQNTSSFVWLARNGGMNLYDEHRIQALLVVNQMASTVFFCDYLGFDICLSRLDNFLCILKRAK